MSKYFAKKTIVDGITFASKKEAKRYNELKLMQKAGIIKDLALQHTFNFPELKYDTGRCVQYRADFSYTDCRTGHQVIEDVKGYKEGAAYAVFRLKKALVKYFYNVEVVEV